MKLFMTLVATLVGVCPLIAATADVVVVDAGVLTVGGSVPPTPATGEVKIGGGAVTAAGAITAGTIVITQTGQAAANQAVRGNDTRLTDARAANGGNAATVGGKGPADFVAVTQRGVANGVATLDGTGKIPSSQLPATGGTPVGDSAIIASYATEFVGSPLDQDTTYTVESLAPIVQINNTLFPNFPFTRQFNGDEGRYWQSSGPWYMFSNEGGANVVAFRFKCVASFGNWQNDPNPEIDFGFHDGLAASGSLPANGAWFNKGISGSTIRFCTGNNGTRTINPLEFTFSTNVQYLFQIEFSQYRGAIFSIWDNVNGTGFPIIQTFNSQNLPAPLVRRWRPSVRHYSTTNNDRFFYLSSMAHQVYRADPVIWVPIPLPTP